MSPGRETGTGEPIRRARSVWGVQHTTHAPEVVVAGRAFERFYRESHAQVARALGITLGDRQLGLEAADEAMVRCFAHWSKVQTYDNPGAWAYRVGLNWARSLRRRLARRPPQPDRRWVDPPATTDPQIEQAIAALDRDLRAVIVCRFFLDWSNDATAEALGIRPGTVKSRVHRALKRLEHHLGHLNLEI